MRSWHGDVCACFDMNDMGKGFERSVRRMSIWVPLLTAS